MKSASNKRVLSGAKAGMCIVVMAFAMNSVMAGMARADDLPTFTIEMKDGAIIPERLSVPAGKAVKIIVKNTGTTPAEFESRRLRQEKVLSPGAESFVVLRGLSPGEYSFFDEFHTGAKPGVIVAE